MADIRNRLKTATGVAVALTAVGVPFVPTPVVSVPVGDVVAPAVALGVVRRILRARSDQIRSRTRPRVLTPDEMEVAGRVLRTAATSTIAAEIGNIADLPHDVRRLVDAVESLDLSGPTSAHDRWSLVVRVTGEPIAESSDGRVAVFGKRRSMELLSWMVLNRDRLSRSAVRNAMWDFPVADSTFGTILSDLRRGLARLTPPPSAEGWCPATFNDRLVLADGIVSDVDLLASAAERGDREGLILQLSRVRDVPFAGTSYLWADLDGTTTRTVITVLDAVDRLVRIGTDERDTAATLTAVKAGLRVMPGDENLLEIQRGLLPHRA